MKKIMYAALSVMLLVSAKSVAQSAAEQGVNDAKTAASDLKVQVTNSRKAINLLVKQLTVLGNPNVATFSNSMSAAYNNRDANATDAIDYVNQATAQTTIPFNAAPALTLMDQILDENDFVTFYLTNQIIDAVNANNTTLALNLVPYLRTSLTKQFNKSTQFIAQMDVILSQIQTFTVCLELVDGQGNTAINGGFGAVNVATGDIIYPGDPNGQDYGYGDCFITLPVGTYQFFSFPSQGSLCGEGNETVTINSSLVNANGIMEISLVTWCE